MDDLDYQNLEALISKLGYEFKANFCLLTGHVQDGFYIGIYDKNGNLSKELSGPGIKDIVRQFKQS